MIGEAFSSIDAGMAAVLPLLVRLSLWATISGVLSMLLYAVSSPQRRLAELKLQTTDLQRQLAAYEGDFGGAMALTQQNLKLAFHRLGLALGPALLAGAPVLLTLFGISTVYEGQQWIAMGPDWVCSWLTGFFVVTSIAAIATKLICRID